MESQLEALVVVLVVHEVDAVHGVCVESGDPFHGLGEVSLDLLEVERGLVVTLDSGEVWSDLDSEDLIDTLVDGVEEQLGEVGAGSEELHVPPTRMAETQQAIE